MNLTLTRRRRFQRIDPNLPVRPAARRIRRHDWKPADARGWRRGYAWPLAVGRVVVLLVADAVIGVLLLTLLLLAWLLMLPLAAAEFVVQGVAGAVLLALRATGLARSRVDVYGGVRHGSSVGTLTTIMVPGFGAAGRLVERLRSQGNPATAVPPDPNVSVRTDAVWLPDKAGRSALLGVVGHVADLFS